MSSGITWDANGFHTGGLEGCAEAVNIIVVTTPATWTSKQTYRAKISNADVSNGFKSKSKAVGTDWVTILFYMRFDAQRPGVSNFFAAYDGSDSHLVLARNSDNVLELYDTNYTLIGTSATGLLADDTDYYFSVKFKKNNSAEIQVEVGEAGSARTLIFDLTGKDLDSGGANVAGQWANGSHPTWATNFFVTAYLCRTDAGANIDTNITTEPNGFTIIGPYESANQSARMDFGDDLSSGSLANVFDVPVTSVKARYTAGFASDKSGGVTMDNATVGGPKGDSRIDGTIVGTIFTWTFLTTGGVNPKWRGKYGWQSSGSERVDNTVFTSPAINTNSAWQSLTIVESESDLPASPEDKMLQMGWMADAPANGGPVDVKGMWGAVIHSEQAIAVEVLASGNLFIQGYEATQSSGNLFIKGIFLNFGQTDLFVGGQNIASGIFDLFIDGHLPSTSSSDVFIEGNDDAVAETSLFVHGLDALQTSGDMYIEGREAIVVSGDLIILGNQEVSNSKDFFIQGAITTSGSSDLVIFTKDAIQTSGDLFIIGTSVVSSQFTLFVDGKNTISSSFNLVIDGYTQLNQSFDLFLSAIDTISITGELFTKGHQSISNSGNLIIDAHEISTNSVDIFIAGQNSVQTSSDLFITGIIDSSGNIDNFIKGKDAESNTSDLFVQGFSERLISNSVDLFLTGIDGTNKSEYLFIKGLDRTTLSANLFIGGFDESSSIVSPTLFINGHNDTSVFGDLLIPGKDNSQLSGDLYILGSDTVSVSGNMYISGPDELSSQINLFIFRSDISAIASSFGLFVNGMEPKPELVCPALDPTASIQIKDSLIKIYQSRIDALINQLGKNIHLEFDHIRVSCPNCTFDNIRKRSTGVYIPGGPRPFSRGRRCPWCKGKGFEETPVTKCIKCLIKWNPQDAKNFGISIGQKRGIVRFKTFLTEADDLIRAKTAIANSDIENQLKFRVRLIKGPIPVGLRERRYCVSFWELI